MRSPRPLDGPTVDRSPDWAVTLSDPLDVDDAPAGRLIGEATHGEFRYWAAVGGDRERRWFVRHRHSAETTIDLDDRTIVVRPDPRAAEGYWYLLLVGSGLAHALAADGHSALHASAVEVDGRAIAFIGPSGKGKTTLAALLCASRARAVTDDVLRCGIQDGEAICFRGGSRLRLRSQAAALADGLRSAERTADERISAVAEPTARERMPLAALVVPRPSRETSEISVRRLRGREAATELLRSPRLAGIFDPRLATRHLDLCRELAARVPVLEATIPWGPPFDPGLAGRLTDRVLSPS